jgi:hypothetical protein
MTGLAVLDYLAVALGILKVVGEGLRVICVQLLGFVGGEGKLALTELARHHHCRIFPTLVRLFEALFLCLHRRPRCRHIVTVSLIRR